MPSDPKHKGRPVPPPGWERRGPTSQTGMTRPGRKANQVEVASGFGAQTRKAYIEVSWPVEAAVEFDGVQLGVMHLEPQEARFVGQLILEAAEAADQDEFLVSFLVNEFKLEWEQAVQILPRFAEWREAKRKKARTPSA